MDKAANEILALVKMMANEDKTVLYAEKYFSGPGAEASMKERTIRFIELLVQDGSAMCFDDNDDAGDLSGCMDDIAEHFHLFISDSWFADCRSIPECLQLLAERWKKNGVRLLTIADPKGRMYPVYAVEEEKAAQIFAQAQRAGIGIGCAESIAGADGPEECMLPDECYEIG